MKPRTRLGVLAVALPLACCAGLPLLLAASAGVGAFVLAGGAWIALVMAAMVAFLALPRLRRGASPGNASSPGANARRPGPLVEVLYFHGCPNHQATIALVERVSSELGLDPEIRLVNVPDQEEAQRLRFLGSPTIRVGGRDVDPDADERTDYALSCRVFRTGAGIVGQPDESWVRAALRRAAGALA